MTKQELIEQIIQKQSYLCVGLDTDLAKIPQHLVDSEDPVFEFNKAIIEATQDLCVAYKPNLAFYEAMGPKGWTSLQRTLECIPKTHFTIADAKRGDIGNTSSMYAQTFFQTYGFDSVTVAPYMGEDSVRPFLDFKDKWTILLALTSNRGADDFEQLELSSGAKVYEEVLKKAITWGNADQLMFVAGATRPEELNHIRSLVPEHFLLIPGVGAQGGDLAAVSAAAMNEEIGILVNSSRSILYASSNEDFALAARKEAEALQNEMSILMQMSGFV
jgi:orotidine-5'-phosphate decarboxylase